MTNQRTKHLEVQIKLTVLEETETAAEYLHECILFWLIYTSWNAYELCIYFHIIYKWDQQPLSSPEGLQIAYKHKVKN